MHDPDLLFLDEPTNGMDPHGRQIMLGLIRDLGNAGISVLLSSHLLPDVEQVCESVVILGRGEGARRRHVSARCANRTRRSIASIFSVDSTAFRKRLVELEVRVEEDAAGGLHIELPRPRPAGLRIRRGARHADEDSGAASQAEQPGRDVHGGTDPAGGSMTQAQSTASHSYQRWDGDLGRGWWTWRAIVWNGLKLAVKQQRNKNLLLMSVLFTLMIGLTLYVIRLLEDVMGTGQARGLMDFIKTFLGVDLSGATGDRRSTAKRCGERCSW